MPQTAAAAFSAICTLTAPVGARAADDSWVDFPLSYCAPGKDAAAFGGLTEAVKKWAELSPYAYATARSYAVGRCLDDSFEIKTQEAHYQKLKDAAKQGSADAELYLAIEHLGAAADAEKAGAPSSDHVTKGMIWLKRSVEHKNPDAMTLLAFHQMNGTYIEKDLKGGQDLLLQAAEAGSLAAREELAEAYKTGGLGLAADPQLTEKWRRSALELAATLNSESIFDDDAAAKNVPAE